MSVTALPKVMSGLFIIHNYVRFFSMRCMTLELLESILLLRTRADNRKGIEEDGMKHKEGSQNDIKRVERNIASVKDDMKRTNKVSDDTIIHVKIDSRSLPCYRSMTMR